MDLLTIAKKIADRVEAESSQQDVPVAVTVIDIHGNVVLTHRMTGASAFSLELAERKAYTSALVACAPPTSSPSCNRGRLSIPCSPSVAGDTPRWAAASRSPATARWSPASESAEERRSRTSPSWKRRSRTERRRSCAGSARARTARCQPPARRSRRSDEERPDRVY